MTELSEKRIETRKSPVRYKEDIEKIFKTQSCEPHRGNKTSKECSRENKG